MPITNEEAKEKALEIIRLRLIELRRAVREELIAQGHVATGQLVNNITIKLIRSEPLIGQLEIFDYAEDLDVQRTVLPPNYRQILYNWSFDVPDLAALSDQERTSFSYAAYNNAVKEGIPTTGALEYSKNGRRTEWSKFTIDNFDLRESDFDEWFDFVIEKVFT